MAARRRRVKRSRSRVNVDVSDVENWEFRLQQVAPVLRRQKRRKHREWAIVAARFARKRAPVLTGRLQRSIRPKRADDPERAGIVISSRGPAYYGLFVEKGYTSKAGRPVAKRPFMRPAIMGRNRRRFKQEAADLALDLLTNPQVDRRG